MFSQMLQVGTYKLNLQQFMMFSVVIDLHEAFLMLMLFIHLRLVISLYTHIFSTVFILIILGICLKLSALPFPSLPTMASLGVMWRTTVNTARHTTRDKKANELSPWQLRSKKKIGKVGKYKSEWKLLVEMRSGAPWGFLCLFVPGTRHKNGLFHFHFLQLSHRWLHSSFTKSYFECTK